MFCDGYGYGFSGMFFGGGRLIMMILFAILAIFIIFEIIKYFKKDKVVEVRNTSTSSNAMSILEEQFALGKIDRQEFEEKRDLLNRR